MSSPNTRSLASSLLPVISSLRSIVRRELPTRDTLNSWHHGPAISSGKRASVTRLHLCSFTLHLCICWSKTSSCFYAALLYYSIVTSPWLHIFQSRFEVWCKMKRESFVPRERTNESLLVALEADSISAEYAPPTRYPSSRMVFSQYPYTPRTTLYGQIYTQHGYSCKRWPDAVLSFCSDNAVMGKWRCF
jgi:hypothetical protein